MNPADVNPVVLLIGSGEPSEAVLRECEATLAAFGLASKRWVEAVTTDPGAAGTNWKNRSIHAVIVASTNGDLPGHWARETGLLTIRVPIEGEGQRGMDLLTDEQGQLPGGPDGGEFATMAIGAAGAKNAALFVVAALALTDKELREKWAAFRADQTAAVLNGPARTLDD